MEITKNQVVVFIEVDGTKRKVGYLEVSYSEKEKSFYVYSNITDDVRLYSNTIVDKPQRKKRVSTTQADITRMKEIVPCGETEKAYQVYDGSNGKGARAFKHYYKYYAKSICIVSNGKVYAPLWA